MSRAKINGCEDKSGVEAAEPFGKGMRKKHFLFNDGYINLNQGIYHDYPNSKTDY